MADFSVLLDRFALPEGTETVAQALGVSPVTAALLVSRGFDTPEKARCFIRAENERFHDPFLLTDMDRACDAVEEAMEKKQLIAVYGDYDADGVTSTALLTEYLTGRGARVLSYIPDRLKEGYGVNPDAVESLAEKGVSLILTVDTGITAHEEIALAHSLGIRFVVTDHHDCPDTLPDAEAVVNPHRAGDRYPFKDLAGVGVAFKLASALEIRRAGREGNGDDFMRRLCTSFLDLVTLGTIADVMPLVGENRLIAALGLTELSRTARPGISALLAQAGSGKKVTSSTVGFTLAPRINAAGRIGNVYDALRLCLTRDRFEAEQLGARLNDLNRKRQEEENAIAKQTDALIREQTEEGNGLVLVLGGEDWHRGVTGIVASRVTEKMRLPSFLISFEGGIGRGSGRSIPGFDLMDALRACSDLLVRCGGHEQAAGITLEQKNLDAFRRRINAYAKAHITEEMRSPATVCDMELLPSDLTLSQAGELSCLEPCGTGNPTPLFLLRRAELLRAEGVSGGRHTRLVLRGEEGQFNAMYFGISPEEIDCLPGERPELAFQLSVNEFNGTRSAQLFVRDSDHSAAMRRRLSELHARVEALANGGAIPLPDEVPTREQFVDAYAMIDALTRGGGAVLSLTKLTYQLREKMSAVCLWLILRVMEDTGVLMRVPVPPSRDSGALRGSRAEYRLNKNAPRVDLMQIPLLRSLNERMISHD